MTGKDEDEPWPSLEVLLSPEKDIQVERPPLRKRKGKIKRIKKEVAVVRPK